MRKTLILFILSVLSLTSFAQSAVMDDKIKVLANDIADQIGKSGKKTVAVSALTFKDKQTEFGKLLAEKLSGKLSTSGRGFTVVNQKMLAELLKQNKLTTEGILVAKNEAAKLGQASGIDAIIYGVITSFGEEIQLTLNIVELKTTNLFGNSEVSFPLTNAIKNMLTPIEPDVDLPTDTGEPEPLPKPAQDCKEKNTCVVCVTNKDNQPIEVIGSFFTDDNNYDKRKYIHSGKTECWQNVTIGIGNDYREMFLNIQRSQTQLKYERIVIEACKTKNHIFN
jgi:Curli production assembly/transport component CsgG